MENLNCNYLGVLKKQEEAVFKFRALFEKYGYLPYKMTKFEEYDLYARNKDFLLSNGVITFTDTNGKLMALKPDVTLSIVKNTKQNGGLNKVYYNENVYRVSESTGAFKEIMQVGLECLGDVDDYTVLEVLCLAEESLKTLSNDYVLSVSDTDIVRSVLSKSGLDEDQIKAVLTCISQKNLGELQQIIDGASVSKKIADALKGFITICGDFDKIKEELSVFAIDDETQNKVNALICLMQEKAKITGVDKTVLDFSVTGNIKYYNGLVFSGVIYGVANSVLSGGCYDRLMKKMGRTDKAIGFAVYLDRISSLFDEEKNYDVDVVLLYDSSVSLSDVQKTINSDEFKGKTVSAMKKIPEKLRYSALVKLTCEGVKIENGNA